MERSLVAIAMVAGLAGLGGCLRDDLVACGAELCSATEVCSPSGAACVDQDQIDACVGLADGAPCTPTETAPGTCKDGVCVQFCGDGVVEAGEQCDDGNTNVADGCDACRLTTWQATATIGSNANAKSIALIGVFGVVIDRSGSIYASERNGYSVQRIDVTGVSTTVAGSGLTGFSGDGDRATTAELNHPEGIAIDGLGNLYIADSANNRIRRVDPDGVITTFAGNGTAGFGGDDGPATNAELSGPAAVVVDGLGDVYIADTNNERIRRVDTTGTITTFAGTGTAGFSGDGTPANVAEISAPYGLVFDRAGNLLFADLGNARIRRIDLNNIITTVAGNGTHGLTGDNGPATSAALNNPEGLAVDAAGVMYIADSGNSRIRQIDTAGMITSIAGTLEEGFGGDGPAISIELSFPSSIAIDDAGDLIFADNGSARVRKIDLAGQLTTVAGNGTQSFTGDGGAPTSVPLVGMNDAAVDASGQLYISDTDNFRVRRVGVDGLITTFAGTGILGTGGDGGPASDAQLGFPFATAFGPAGDVYIADEEEERVRRVDAAGIITTFAGTGDFETSGDGGPATSAGVQTPCDIAVDAAGNVYISELNGACVRRVDPNGIITTYAGGHFGSDGDGGPATAAGLHSPCGLDIDAIGNLYISDTANNKIRRVAPNGIISTFAGNGAAGFGGDGGAATSAELQPAGIALDAQGALYIADNGNYRVRKVSPGGTISTIAGTGVSAFTGDGGPAATAQFLDPATVAVGPAGDLYIADSFSQTVRHIDLNGNIAAVAGPVDPPGMGPIALARLADPRALAVGTAFSFIAGGSSGTVQAIVAQSASVAVVAGRYPQSVATGQLARFRDNTFGTVTGIAYDEAGGFVYLSESSANRIHVVTIVDPADSHTWTIATLAGTGAFGYADGAAATAEFRGPTGLYFDATGRQLYVADTGNHVIRAIDLATEVVRTVAGTPATIGYFGDGGAATSALLYAPSALARCPNGDLFIADTGNNRIRRVDSTGTITSVIGDGIGASSGEGQPASTFPINAPLGIACDALGDVYATSTTTVRQLPADDSGVVDGTGPVFTIYGAAPRDTFPARVTTCLSGIAVVDASTVRVTDSCTGLLVELARQ